MKMETRRLCVKVEKTIRSVATKSPAGLARIANGSLRAHVPDFDEKMLQPMTYLRKQL